MDITKISAGKDVPNEINVIIEIPMGGAPIKYEVDKDSGALWVDRFLHTSMVYPCNYGFIPQTLSDDGDPADVLVVTNLPVVAGCVIKARPIGVLIMEDESGIDEKIIAVPITKTNPYYKDVAEYTDLPEILLEQIKHFFERYKDLEPNKWVKVKEWQGSEKAKEIIKASLSS